RMSVQTPWNTGGTMKPDIGAIVGSGRLEVESAPGRGTRVRAEVRLPAGG
ncbi:MAG: hypothetical protein QOF33_4484, partial [Thermomicrobiales bacterium]|nr:hypothetical protein [Thermomicrobiales bacterium]